jgi:ParB-like chromosome segregation protein Spo0J
VQYIDIKKLKPHPENPRKISFKELEALCDSIKENQEYFEARPIITDKKFLVWAGNSRYKAALKLGLKEVPVHVIDLPVEKMKEIMIRDNVNNGQWESAMLLEWDLEDLTKFGLEFTKSFDENNLTEQEEKAEKKNKTKTIKTIICPHCNKEFEL